MRRMIQGKLAHGHIKSSFFRPLLVVFLATRNTTAIGMVQTKSRGTQFVSFYLGRYYFIAEVLPVSHKPYDPTVCIRKYDNSTNATKDQAHYLNSKVNAKEQHMHA